MNTAKSLIIFLVLTILSALTCNARVVQSLDMKALVKKSSLVFVGDIKSVEPSGLTTELTYPTWEGVVFEWLKVEVVVVEPIKVTKKGNVVRTLMLSTQGAGPTINAPGMLNPKVGQHYLFCLLPTTLDGVYASITAPFDDDQGIFLLDRKFWTDGTTYHKDGKIITFQEQSERNAVLWSLINDKGQISSEGAAKMRKKFRAEIATSASKDAVVYLKWKKEKNDKGWQWSAPDVSQEKTKDAQLDKK